MKPEELTADDLDTLAKLQRTEFEPQIRELTHRLGSRAVEKLIAYAQRDAPYVPPTVGQVMRAKLGDCYERCGRQAEAGSSRCELCGPGARERCDERNRKAEIQNQREQAALARMWAATK